MKRMLYVIFFLSGATGLVYEVVWVRLTGLVFGNTSHAIATVLGAFMAGLALGSWQLGRRADRVANPLRMYGLLEIGIGISAALVPFIFRAWQSFYWSIAPSVSSAPAGDAVLRFGSSFVILLLPTFLMGGTLPVLIRFFTHAVEEVERKVALLYALNTFGAAAGTLLAALALIPVLGSLRTTFLIAAINIALGLVALGLSRRSARPADVPSPETLALEQPQTASAATDTLILLTLAVSGFVSMLYEVAWTRALAAMIGSSTYAFSIMLVTFLVGIAVGSSLISRRRPAANLRLLGLLQLGIAAGGLLFLTGYLLAPYAVLGLIRAFFYSFQAVLTIQFVLCAALMIFATLCMGATLPVATQLYSRKFVFLGRSVGNIYSVNTIGAILGSVVAGFLLMPSIGTERTIVVGLFLNSAMAVLLLTEAGSRGPRAAAVVLLLAATISMRGGVFWNSDALDRGILIYSQQFGARPELTINEHYEDTDVVYFKEGNNASISVRKGENYLGLRTNGKVDASNRNDMITQLAIGYLPGFYHPNPKSALVIGFGSGVTVGATTAFKEIETIDCVEIEPAVVGAAHWFSDVNRKSYENPRVNIIFNDARNYMNTTRKQYDIIISEPSNPWIAGVASLFTAEFYDRAAEVLKSDGVFAQWVQLYELDPEDLRMIFKEFSRKFPEVSVWVTESDLIMIGTRQPQKLDVGRIVRLFRSDPTVVRDFRDYIHIDTPEGFLAYYVMSGAAVQKFGVTPRRNTDDHPLLEFHAPRQLFTNTRDLNLELLYESKDGLFPPGTEAPDPGAAYAGMIEPFLLMQRPNLGNQSMALLAQVPGKQPGSLPVSIAKLNLDSGNLNRAEDALKQADGLITDAGPLMGDKEELWGLFYDTVGNTEMAAQHFQLASQADPTRPLPLRKLAEINAKNQAWDQAAHWMQQYIGLNPTSLGHSWAILGDYQLAAGKLDDSVQSLGTALKIDPYSYWAHYRMARVFEQRKDSANAISEYEFLARYSFDRDPDIYLNLANLYKEAGRNREARRLLAKGHRILPTNSAIYRLYREMQEPE
jgi:spermidine synthase